MRKVFTVTVAILLVSSMLMMFAQFPQGAKAEGNWLNGWAHRKSVIVSTGLHVITAYNDAGNDVLGHVYLDGACQTDFDDVRFTGPDGETLISGVTIRRESTGIYAEFKLPVSSSPIYVYYGNPAVTAYYSNEPLGSGSFGDTDQLTQSYVVPSGGEISGIARTSPVTGYATSLEAVVSSTSGSTAQMALLLMRTCEEYVGDPDYDPSKTLYGRRIIAFTETKIITDATKHREVFTFDTPIPIFKDTLYGIALLAGEGTRIYYQASSGSASFKGTWDISGDFLLYPEPSGYGTYALGRFINYEGVDWDEQGVLFRDNADYTRSRSMWHGHWEQYGAVDAEPGQGIGGSYALNSTVWAPDDIGWGELAFLGAIADGNKRFWSGVVRLSALPGLGSHVELMSVLRYPAYDALNGFGVDKTEAGVQWRLSVLSGTDVWSHTLFGEVQANTNYLVILSYETDGVDSTSEVWVTKLSEPDLLLEASPSAALTTTDNGLGDMFFIGAADYMLGNVSATSAFFDEMTLTEDFPATFGAWESEFSSPTGSIVINDGTAFTSSTSVTLSLTYSDPTSGVAQVRYSNDGTWDTEPWETPTPSKSWFLTSGDGTKTVYYQIKNTLEIISETYSDNIVLDTNAPTGSIVINDDDALTSSTTVTLTLTATDTTSGVAQVRYSNDGVWDTETWETPTTTKTWTLTTGDGTKTVHYQIQDNAGNTATLTDTITLDTTAPTGTITINDDAAATNSESVTLALTYSDPTSGVAEVRYSNDGTWDTEPWETPTPSKSWFLTSGDETKTVYYQIKNTLEIISETYSDNIVLDTNAPTGSIVINDGYAFTSSSLVSLSLVAIDTTSGIAQVRYSNDGVWDTETWETPTTTKTWTLTTGDGTKTVHYQIQDNAGNTVDYSDTITLETNHPTGSITINDGTAFTSSTSVTLSLTYSDPTSGVAQVRYSNDGVWDTEEWETPTTTKTWTLTTGDGTKTVHYQIKDAAGNIADYSDAITLDTTPPTGTITINQGATTTSATVVTLSLSAEDTKSGVAQVRYSNDGVWDTETWETPTTTKTWTLTTGDGTKTVHYQIQDNAGNTATLTDTITLATPTPTPTPSPTPSPTPVPTPTPSASPSPTPSTSPTPSPDFEPSPLEDVQAILIALGVALATAAVGLLVFMRKKK